MADDKKAGKGKAKAEDKDEKKKTGAAGEEPQPDQGVKDENLKVPYQPVLDEESKKLDQAKTQITGDGPCELKDFRLLEGTASKNKNQKEEDKRCAVWIKKAHLVYEIELKKLQIELMKMQTHQKKTGTRILAIFEGRDAAGKGGTIKRITAFLNPRNCRVVALSKPSDIEVTQWYFQRYVAHLPAAGELAIFDRSWYNRAMVEPVMGFCSDEQHKRFLKDVPLFEEMLVKDGIKLFKFYFSVSKEVQRERFDSRKLDLLKQYKLSPVDNLAQKYWDQYTVKKFQMLNETNRSMAPWTIIRSDDKKNARINCMRHILGMIDYEGKPSTEELMPDPQIIISGIDEIKHMEEHLFNPEVLRG